MDNARVTGASLVGCGAELVTVEARFVGARKGRTEVLLTGLPDSVLRESRGKLLGVLQAHGLRLGPGRLYLNLVPAGRRKSGMSLDLALVVAATCAAGHVAPRAVDGPVFLGEVGIDGQLHPVPGGLAAALAARAEGLPQLIASTETAREAACLSGLDVRAAGELGEVLRHLTHEEHALPRAAPHERQQARRAGPGLDEVQGHAVAKHALGVAAAGGHGLLFVGPPGAGKSMLARRLGRLLPPPGPQERLEISAVEAACGRPLPGLAHERPFRAPHHSASLAGLIGGGPQLAPGEVSRAHGGVLFLDELPEFRREALEALRLPLEEGLVLVSRAGRQVEFPARFQLVTAMNPCPCGYHGHPARPCRCSPGAIQRYRQRLSGPLLDRVELRLELAPPTVAELAGGGQDADPETRETRLVAAVQRAAARRIARGQAEPNARLGPVALETVSPLDGPARRLLERAAGRRALSARALQGLRRVARTLADLEDADRTTTDHLAQALALRAPL